MVGELVNRLFEGDAAALVSHLVESGGMEDTELERLRALIDAADGRGVSES
jgi:predicted transcriptional regulator